jgi:hypothetical protein
MRHRPFFNETKALFDSVSSYNVDRLVALYDKDGLNDLDTESNNVVLRKQNEWQDWFYSMVLELHDLDATISTDILSYEAARDGNIGYSFVNFCQNVFIAGHQQKFYCTAKIAWKRVGNTWKESKLHVSLIDTYPQKS